MPSPHAALLTKARHTRALDAAVALGPPIEAAPPKITTIAAGASAPANQG